MRVDSNASSAVPIKAFLEEEKKETNEDGNMNNGLGSTHGVKTLGMNH